MPYLKTPTVIRGAVDAHHKWMKLLEEAERLVAEDSDLQVNVVGKTMAGRVFQVFAVLIKNEESNRFVHFVFGRCIQLQMVTCKVLQRKAAEGLHLKERRAPAEVLGRFYAQYCDVINRMYDSYLTSVHLQRAPCMLDLICVIWKRLYELRNELVHYIVSDYVYVDGALVSLKKTPYDIQIAVPYHYPLERRSEGVEQLLKSMWIDAERRKNEPEPAMDHQAQSTFMDDDDAVGEFQSKIASSMTKSQIESHEAMPAVENEEKINSEEFIQATILQKHERYRQFFIRDFKAKCRHRRLHSAQHMNKPPKHLRIAAAGLIQRVYRRYMSVKREHLLNHKRDLILGIVEDPFQKRLDLEEENNKIYERKRRIRRDIRAKYYTKEIEKEKTRLMVFKKDNQIEDITEHIMTWFQEWIDGYGFFPQYPYEAEGGTVMVIREDYPYIEEQIEEDDRLAKLMKGKTKEQLVEEQRRAKEEAQMKEELEKEKMLKEAENLFKMRCNPLTDPGYRPQQSDYTGNISEALRKYRAAWSIHDRFPDSNPSAVFGYLQSVLTEELMNQLHLECRKYVDELRRLDLKLLNKMQQLMFKRIGKKFPKIKPRKRPKLPPPHQPFTITDKMLEKIQILFDLNIVFKPSARIKDICGDLNFKAYDYIIKDPDAKFLPPSYGEIRRRLTLSCVFGMGIEPGPSRNKSVMLLGPERNGKSFMVDAVCGELDAVKIDISPEVFSAVVKKPKRVLSDVFTAARLFQPAVIFMRNIERVFTKKVPPQERYLKTKGLKGPLTKLIRQMSPDDKVIFIATCSKPFAAKAKPMVSIFSEVLLVPRTDYSSLQRFLLEKFQRIRSMPVDFCVSALARCLQGYGIGVIMENFDKVMTPERIIRLNVTPLTQTELLEPLIEAGIEPITLEEYQEYMDFFIRNSPLKKERGEYEIINKTRAYVYEKLARDEKEEN